MKKYFKKIELFFRNRKPFEFRTKGERVFFPGCSLTSSDPELVEKVYSYLREQDPEIGLWSACCGKPLSINKNQKNISSIHINIKKIVEKNKITELITSCGNCIDEFNLINLPVKVTSLYEVLSEHNWNLDTNQTEWTVHHPCPARVDKSQKDSFIKLSKKVNLNISNISDNHFGLNCCLVKSESAKDKIKKHRDKKLITYCAHCTRTFQSDIETHHILQLLFNSDKCWNKINVIKQFVGFNRLRKLISNSKI